MSDRELLELAAKAAGMEGMRYASPYMGMVKMIDPSQPNETGSIGPDWNPRTNDDDALRLAVKLKIHLEIFDGYTIASYRPNEYSDWIELVVWGDDPYETTRLAIVRAAAEIGRNI